MNALKLSLFIGIFAVLLAVAAWVMLPSGINPANAALAEYQIDKLTCGACVSNIESALSGLSGVGGVEVNLTSNRGRVTYDPQQIDSSRIADVITSAGYPARLKLDLDPNEYQALEQEQELMGQKYLAKVGGRLLSRADFEKMVRERNGGVVPPGQEDRIWQTVWKDVLQRELLLAAAEQNQVLIQPGELDLKIEELQKGHQGLEQLVVKRYGSMDAFRERIREDLIINRNIEDHVYAGVSDPQERQNRLQNWYANLQQNTDVIIFDQKLKSSSKGSGCACCNS